MTNLGYINKLLHDLDETDDEELVQTFRCPYSCADKGAPCEGVADEFFNDHLCAACIREWLRKKRKA